MKSLHDEIMNIKSKVIQDDTPIRLSYNHGFADARHAAAELANEHDALMGELLEALEGYDQIVRITIKRLIRQYGKEDDDYALELKEKLSSACEAIAKAKGEVK